MEGGGKKRILYCEGVREKGIGYVVHDTWVFVAVCARKRDAFGQLDGAVARDFDLHAVGIELSATAGVGDV